MFSIFLNMFPLISMEYITFLHVYVQGCIYEFVTISVVV